MGGAPSGLARGANRRAIGEAIARSEEALAEGRHLEPRDIALVAALGLGSLEVRRRPRLAVFSTGNEMCDSGRPLAPAAIYDSNRYAVTALHHRPGYEVTDLGILQDDRDAFQANLLAASKGHDLILTSGARGRRADARRGG